METVKQPAVARGWGRVWRDEQVEDRFLRQRDYFVYYNSGYTIVFVYQNSQSGTTQSEP